MRIIQTQQKQYFDNDQDQASISIIIRIPDVHTASIREPFYIGNFQDEQILIFFHRNKFWTLFLVGNGGVCMKVQKDFNQKRFGTGIQIGKQIQANHYLMKAISDSQSLQDIELKQAKATTPDSMVRGEETAELLPVNNGWRCYWKRCMFLAMLVVCSVMLGIEINAQGTTIIGPEGVDVDQFNFLVYCPVSYIKRQILTGQEQSDGPSDELRRRRRLFEAYKNKIQVQESEKVNFDPNRTYLVQANSITYNDSNNNITTRLFYCGLVRGFYDTCENAFVACSTPGPMFDIPARNSVDIIWVNNLDENNVPPVGTASCMNQSYVPSNGDTHFCNIMTKINRTQTYLDPTGLTLDSPINHNVKIGPKAWPITIHVHGAEVRPTFDGHPLSWTDNGNYSDGHIGVGTFSMNDKCYYDQFDKIDNQAHVYNPPNIALKNVDGFTVKNFKMNRYPNLQNPGTLWYHDHAMHLTSYNVQYGLAGFYILRDENVEQQIGVDRSNQKLVMVSNINLTTSFLPLQGFQTGEVYRFRFLNNNFNGANGNVWRISFSYNNCNDNISDREVFSIIGADSSLFSRSIDHQQSFVISHAERMEILIIFDKGQTSFSICGDTQITSITGSTDKPHPGHDDDNNINTEAASSKSIPSQSQKPSTYKLGYSLIDRDESVPSKNNRTTIDNVILDVPYTDFSKIQESKIAVKRMRPLIFVGNQIFTIHGRVDFHKGKSENPMLGTIQDWYLINAISFAHPIHVHLINFQVVKEYDLRKIITTASPQQKSTTCSIYELDFFIEALLHTVIPGLQKYKDIAFVNGKDTADGINYENLCNNLLVLGRQKTFYESLSSIFPEDHIDPTTKVSGLNLFPTITPQDQRNLNGLNINPPINFSDTSAFKYIKDAGAPPAKPYYSKWKDTAYVDGFKVLQYRLRWTKSNFTEDDAAKGNYFHVPADQLREYPGFVYHCHILPHEDNEMMRPIMLQLPNNTVLGNTTCNYNIESKQKVLKWSDKYNCVNKQCGNKPT